MYITFYKIVSWVVIHYLQNVSLSLLSRTTVSNRGYISHFISRAHSWRHLRVVWQRLQRFGRHAWRVGARAECEGRRRGSEGQMWILQRFVFTVNALLFWKVSICTFTSKGVSTAYKSKEHI